MKRFNNLYDFSLEFLEDVYHDVRPRVKNKKRVEMFDDYFSSNICLIKDLIDGGINYNIHYNIFLIYEPKCRIIMSTNLVDKVINHAFAYKMLPILEPCLIDENVATRKGKGTNYGIKKLILYLREMKGEIFALKFDISKYFYNIDHDILLDMISSKIKDKRFMDAMERIIRSTDEGYVNEVILRLKGNALKRASSMREIREIERIPLYERGKGLPIGNMTSQLLAIFYLNYLDHYIKEKLKVKYYIRYMDDGVLLSNSKEYLIYCLNEIRSILFDLKLCLNLPKTRIINVSKEGIDFLGFRFYKVNNRVFLRVRNRTKNRFKRFLFDLDRVCSYTGYLNYGNCNYLLRDNRNLVNRDIIDKIMKRKRPFIRYYGRTDFYNMNGFVGIEIVVFDN